MATLLPYFVLVTQPGPQHDLQAGDEFKHTRLNYLSCTGQEKNEIPFASGLVNFSFNLLPLKCCLPISQPVCQSADTCKCDQCTLGFLTNPCVQFSG